MSLRQLHVHTPRQCKFCSNSNLQCAVKFDMYSLFIFTIQCKSQGLVDRLAASIFIANFANFYRIVVYLLMMGFCVMINTFCIQYQYSLPFFILKVLRAEDVAVLVAPRDAIFNRPLRHWTMVSFVLNIILP